MILPNKYIYLTESYYGLGALILQIIGKKKMTIDVIWEKFKEKYTPDNIYSFPNLQKILCTLIFLFTIKILNVNDKGEIYNENLEFNNL
ncbi:ABC-three component system middle component 6 [Mycoplasmopsis primatum]|uniref:ABC-three component system middle component 6 n=2 Tax=Mycoplasmopsis primatum TaxID=55604 RepID=UPI00049532AA|nr:ABC-three component system middle component 6 [Mycoplasmopsis primatum]